MFPYISPVFQQLCPPIFFSFVAIIRNYHLYTRPWLLIQFEFKVFFSIQPFLVFPCFYGKFPVFLPEPIQVLNIKTCSEKKIQFCFAASVRSRSFPSLGKAHLLFVGTRCQANHRQAGLGCIRWLFSQPVRSSTRRCSQLCEMVGAGRERGALPGEATRAPLGWETHWQN